MAVIVYIITIFKFLAPDIWGGGFFYSAAQEKSGKFRLLVEAWANWFFHSDQAMNAFCQSRTSADWL